MIQKLRILVRAPLVHFLLIGAGIYALYGVLASGDNADNERIVRVSAADIQSLADQWTRLWNRPPTEKAFQPIVGRHSKIPQLDRCTTVSARLPQTALALFLAHFALASMQSLDSDAANTHALAARI